MLPFVVRLIHTVLLGLVVYCGLGVLAAVVVKVLKVFEEEK